VAENILRGQEDLKQLVGTKPVERNVQHSIDQTARQTRTNIVAWRLQVEQMLTCLQRTSYENQRIGRWYTAAGGNTGTYRRASRFALDSRARYSTPGQPRL